MNGAAASNGSVASAPGSLGVWEAGPLSPELQNSQQRQQQRVASAPGSSGVWEDGTSTGNSPELQNSQQQQQHQKQVASAPGSSGVWEDGTSAGNSPELQNSRQRQQQPGRATVYDGVHADLTGAIINAAIEVHTELGCGLKEEAYEAALAWELTQRGHKVLRQVPCPVVYKGNVFCQDDEHPKRIDLLVDDRIVVELKAVCTRHPVFAAQCRTYLRMLNLPAGLVLNFGFPSLREGIEHVSNPKATPSPLQNSKTPSSDSNSGLLPLRGVPEFGRMGPLPGTLQNSKTPSSDSNTGDRLLPPRGVPEIRNPDSQPPPPLQNSNTPSSESKENGV